MPPARPYPKLRAHGPAHVRRGQLPLEALEGVEYGALVPVPFSHGHTSLSSSLSSLASRFFALSYLLRAAASLMPRREASSA